MMLEYYHSFTDVEGKVIHVVNRSPPPNVNSSSASGSPASSGPTTRSTSGAGRPSVSMSSIPSNFVGDMMNSVMSSLPGTPPTFRELPSRYNTPDLPSTDYKANLVSENLIILALALCAWKS